MIHELKCWPEFFEPISEDRKTHDLRRAGDRNFQIGDLLRLREFDPRTQAYTGREQLVEVTYITSAQVPCALSNGALDPGYCILSIKRRVRPLSDPFPHERYETATVENTLKAA